MALQKLPVVSAVPTDGTSPASLGAAQISNSSGIRVLSKCTAGAGNVFLARWEPELGQWFPYGFYAPIPADASNSAGGKIDGRYLLDHTGPVEFVLVCRSGFYGGLTLDDASTWIEGVQL